jgi:hypothetical protein
VHATYICRSAFRPDEITLVQLWQPSGEVQIDLYSGLIICDNITRRFTERRLKKGGTPVQ